MVSFYMDYDEAPQRLDHDRRCHAFNPIGLSFPDPWRVNANKTCRRSGKYYI